MVACLEGAWPHLIGEKPASVSRPVRFSDSELIVEVFDKDWLDTLKRLEPDLLKKLQAAAGTIIKRVRVTVGKSEKPITK